MVEEPGTVVEVDEVVPRVVVEVEPGEVVLVVDVAAVPGGDWFVVGAVLIEGLVDPDARVSPTVSWVELAATTGMTGWSVTREPATLTTPHARPVAATNDTSHRATNESFFTPSYCQVHPIAGSGQAQGILKVPGEREAPRRVPPGQGWFGRERPIR